MMKKYFFATLLFLFALFSSCSKHLHQTNKSDPILYPPPPDTTRIQFLTRFSGSSDFDSKRSKFKSFVVGKENSNSIGKPYGLAVSKGNIFICDAGMASIHHVNLENNTIENFIPADRGSLKQPINCFVDENGDLYVTDVVRKQVIIFNKDLEYSGEISGDENFKPTDVVVVNNKIMVTDPKKNKINVYSRSSLQLLYSFPEAKVGDENFLYNPLNLCTADGKLYVTDFGHSRIKIFTIDGEYLESIGNLGKSLGQFVRPKGIAVDRNQNLYVVDAAFSNVQIFNETNQLLMFIGGPYNGPGDLYLPAKVTIDYENIIYYENFVEPGFDLKYIIYVTNQYGPDKITVYGRVVPKS